MLTKNEKLLCADALNGTMLLIDSDTDYLRMMIGSDPQPEGTCCGLYAEISDAISLNHLDEKWQVNGKELLRKISQDLTPVTRETLIRTIAHCWERNDADFERTLDDLAL